MPKYTITIKSAEELAALNGTSVDGWTDFSGKTLTGYTKIESGIYKGCYEGRYREDDFDEADTIFLDDEVAFAVEE
jgi:hypothetical protein